MDTARREWIERWASGWKEVLDERASDPNNLYPDMALSSACGMILELLGVPERARDAGSPALAGGESRPTGENPATGAGRTPSSAASGLSQEHAEVVARLVMLFRNRKDDLDLALMKVIAEGGSPAEWLAEMLRDSMPPVEEQPPRARFLGEGC